MDADRDALQAAIQSAELIGKGVSCHVYKLRFKEKWYALKCINKSEDLIDQASFQREQQCLFALKGVPNTVQLVTTLNLTKHWGLLFSYYKSTLYEMIHSRTRDTGYVHDLSGSTVIQMARTLLTALERIHERGVLHLDLKPHNILCNDGDVSIADFGLSMPKSVRWPTGLVYTSWYRPPEAWNMETPTEKSDTWALGCVIYEMLTRRVLFRHQEDTHPEDVMFAFEEFHTRNTSFAKQRPCAYQFLKKMLAISPKERYSPAEALKDVFLQKR